jgi:hypothetical protein
MRRCDGIGRRGGFKMCFVFHDPDGAPLDLSRVLIIEYHVRFLISFLNILPIARIGFSEADLKICVPE